MMKAISICAAVLFFSGCSMSPNDSITYQKNNGFEWKKFQTNSNESLSASDLRKDYKEKTGMDLPNQSTFECQKDALCYYNKYANAYGTKMNEFEEEKRKKEAVLAQKQVDECMANEQCAAKKKVENASFKLNNLYYGILAQNQYLQADYDAAVRRMCRSAGEAQRNGVSQDNMQKNIDLLEGIAPDTRYQIKQVAEACWTLSRYGVPDGTTEIKSRY
ncbi:TPA: hypothetical protein NQF56_002398 [Klebsiella variicola]|nr:hypothetical protein [Klebsiella variicola]